MYNRDRRWTLLALVLLVGTELVVCPSRARAENSDQYEMGSRHYAGQRWQLAADEFREYLDKTPAGPRTADARFYLAESLVQLNDYAAARTAFELFLAKHPDHELKSHAAFRLGEIAYLQGQTDAARTRLEKFVAEYANDANAASAHVYLAEMARARGDTDEAVASFEKALKLEPRDDIAGRCRFGLASAKYDQGHLEEAHDLWLLVAESSSSFADDARLRLASLCLRREQFPEALKHIEQLSGTRTDLIPHAAYWKGRVLSAQGQHRLAAEAWQQGAAQSKGSKFAPRLTYEAGKAWRSAGQPKTAIERWTSIDGLPQNHEWADDALAEIALTHLGEQQLAKSIDACKLLATQFPDSARLVDVERRLAVQLLEAQQYENVLSLLDHVTHPTRRESAQYFCALAELGLKKYDAALTRLDALSAQSTGIRAEDILAARVSAVAGARRYADVSTFTSQYLTTYPTGRHAATCRSQAIRALLQQGRVNDADAALHDFELAHAEHPEIGPLMLLVGDGFRDAQDFAKARSHYEKAAEHDTSRTPALLGQARCYLATANPAQAAKTLEDVPAQPDFAKWRADYCWLMAKATEHAGDAEGALDMCSELLTLPRHRRTCEAQRLAARLLEKLDRQEEAAELLQRLADENPDYVDHDSVLYQWAWILVDLDRTDEADQVFQRLYTAHPDSSYWPDATYRLAERAARRNDNVVARQLLDELIENGRNADAQAHGLYLLGQLAAGEKQWAETTEWMSRLILNHPATAMRLQAEYWLAESAYRQGKHDEAEQRFARLAPHTATIDEPWVAMVGFRRAQHLARRQEWAEALEYLEPLRSRFPEFAQQHEADYLHGRCLMSLARFDDSRKAFEQVLDSSAKGTETAAMAQWMIGETYMHQRQYDEALRAYHRVELRHRFPKWQAAAALQIGKCHEAREEITEAAAAYARAADEYGDSPYAEEARRRSEGLNKSTATAPRATSR